MTNKEITKRQEILKLIKSWGYTEDRWKNLISPNRKIKVKVHSITIRVEVSGYKLGFGLPMYFKDLQVIETQTGKDIAWNYKGIVKYLKTRLQEETYVRKS